MAMPGSISKSSSSTSGSVGCEATPCQWRSGDRAMTMNGLQDLIDEGMRLATAQLFSESCSVLLVRKDDASDTAVEVIKTLAMCDRDRKYSVWIGGSTLSSKSTFQQLWTSKHHELCCRHPLEFVHQGRFQRQRRHVPTEW